MKKTKKKLLTRILSIQVEPTAPVQNLSYDQAMTLASNSNSNGFVYKAEFILRQVVATVKTDPIPWTMLLRNLLNRGLIVEARHISEQMFSLFPKDSSILIEVSKYYRKINELDKSIALLEEGLKTCKDIKPVYSVLGSLYTSNGDKAKAANAFAFSLKLNPNDSLAYFGLSRVLKEDKFAPYMNKLDALLASKDLNSIQKSQLYFAKAYQLQKADPSQYFELLHQGNAEVAVDHLESQSERYTNLLELREFFNKELISCVEENQVTEDFSPIFVAAMPRSGTTLLEQILGAHSAIEPIGESGAFAAAIMAASSRFGVQPKISTWKNGKDFLQYLPTIDKSFKSQAIVQKAKGRRIVEKGMENYIFAGLLMLMYPKAKIIHLTRHPLDIVLSCYHQYFENGFDYLFNLEAIATHYLHYNEQMTFWKELFPNRIYSLTYEDLVSDQEQKTRELLDYCELPWQDNCLSFYDNISAINTASTLQVRQPMYNKSIGAWKIFAEQLAPAARILGLDKNKAEETDTADYG